MSEEVEKSKGQVVTKAELYQAYRTWNEDNDDYALKMGPLTKRLKEHGLSEGRSGQKRYWKDIQLIGRGSNSSDVENGPAEDEKPF